MYPLLSSPIKIGNVTFRNRMFSSPTSGTDITPDHCIGPKTTAYYELKAKGGAAAVTISAVKVHAPTDGSNMSFDLNLETLGSLASFTYTADAIRRHGAVPSMLMSHGGQFAGAYMKDKARLAGLVQYGPVDCVRYDGVPVRALTHEQIADIVKAYGEKAALAKRAGFEMLTVHGGHGWLLNQFFSPYFNKRTDEYGGSLENRVRLAREVLTSIRDAVGPGFPIEIRLSGREGMEVAPAPRAGKVLVIGGGIGGMQAAVTAAQRGHKVILCEKTGQLGGILKSEQIIPFKREMYELSLSFARQLEREGVEVRLNTDVTPEYAEAVGADAAIVAVGSEPLVPPIPGLKGGNVVVVNQYYLESEKVGDTVVVLGGGLAGCECAVHLAREGKTVHIVEMRGDVAIDANVRHRPALMREIEKQGIVVHTNCAGKQVTGEGVL